MITTQHSKHRETETKIAENEANIRDSDSGYGTESHYPTRTRPPTDKPSGVDKQLFATRHSRQARSWSHDSAIGNEEANETLHSNSHETIQVTDSNANDEADTAARTRRANDNQKHDRSSPSVTSASSVGFDQKIFKEFLSLISG